ncbi:hypothetical protein FGG08_001576 [Glutinoglossum americanum]|uniref:Uncharacterized protein n=1 Tax=Glutinoglossum americanum TaxID=1670608 RepID=A0A9P8IGP5_9PEZI|nr:hypothetical protein FGG08_001576 [Glutinoglossum americanum]
MPSTPYFSLPLHASRQPLSLRAARYKQSRKRKRDNGDEQVGEEEEEEEEEEDNDGDDDGHDDDGGDSDSVTEGGSSNSRATAEGGHVPISGFTPITHRSLAALATPIDAQQYQTAGQPIQEPLPDTPFPHRSANPLGQLGPGRGIAATRICQEELALSSPPLFVPNSSYTKVSPIPAPHRHSKLRQHHLSVLTTVFHRCVLDGDFLRAGRAWGMILRAESGGKGVHLRREGRWGIGAEILLRRDTEMTMSGDTTEQTVRDSNGNTEHPEHSTGAWFTRQGFEKAKEYYERLALQYQFRKWVPHSVSSLDFYPAMFSTWIYTAQAEYKVGQNGSGKRPEASLSQRDRLSGSEPTPSPRLHERHTSEQENPRKKTLREAEEIAARMDELMLSPPYSDSIQLWKLRGMVSLWISDLCMAPFPLANKTMRGGRTNQGSERVDNSIMKRNHEQSLQRRNEEIGRAKTAFEKAGREGAAVWEGHLSSFEDGSNEGAMDDSQGE